MFDFIVVGQGLAGTALTYALRERGADVLIVDRCDTHSASRVAAGLITPISGKRLTLVPDFDRLRATAADHYRLVATQTGQPCFVERPALRFYSSADEFAAVQIRRPRLGGHITDIDPRPAAGLADDLQGLQMPHAARLDAMAYLDGSRRLFTAQGIYRQLDIDMPSIKTSDDGVVLNGGELEARRLVFCTGFAEETNPWLPRTAFDAAKGEVLTLRIAGFAEQRTLHAAGCWLAPTSTPEVYRCGATYDHTDLSSSTTSAARETLTTRLATFLALPYEVLSQEAAIRPIGRGRTPIVGCHPDNERIGWLNGLGSKGALWAPTLAPALADHLEDGRPLGPTLARLSEVASNHEWADATD